MTFLISIPPTTVRVYLIDLTSTYNSIYGPAARKKKKEARAPSRSWQRALPSALPFEKWKEARDTLALLAKGFALCTPMYEWMSV